jgi:hypothetical protein
MLMTIASLIAIAYLPGAIIFRLPIADRSKRASLPAEERLFWAVIISIVVTTTIAFALAAIGAYSLRVLAACNAVLAATLALASRGRLRLDGARWPRWTAVLPAALIAAGVWMYFAVPAAEYVIGGRDPGVYMNEGIQIAQSESLVTTDRIAAGVPTSTRDLFFPSYFDPNYYSVRFMGFHLRDPDTGAVTGQFPQGYPVWIAIAYGLDGVTGTRRVIAWWAILGVLTVYFAANRLIGPLPAAAAAGLLCVHVIQTWYARYPNSEIVTQALLFAALLAHAYAHEDDDRFFGPVAASLLGLALFTRFPVVLPVAAAGLASLLAHVSGHRARRGFLVTMTAWIVASAVYYLTQLRPYFGRPIAYVQSLEASHVAMLAFGAAAAGVVIWASRQPRVSSAIRTSLPALLIAIVTTGAVYALFLRAPGGTLAPHDAHAVRVFADLYFTRLAFALAIVGYALLVWRSFWRAPALILAVTAVSLFFFYKMRIWPENFWLARRFLTEILPGAFIFVSAAVFAPLWIVTPRRSTNNSATTKHEITRVRGILSKRILVLSYSRARPAVFATIGIVVTALLGYRYLAASLPIRKHVEYAEVIPRIERLASRFGDTDLVLFEARAASDLHVLALPLSYIYARNVLVLYESRPDKGAVREFLTWAHERYDNVYFFAGGGTDLLSPGVGAVVVETQRFQVPEYQKTAHDVYPTAAVGKPFDFTIYKLVKTALTPPPHSLDIGGTDDLHLVDFYPKERLGGGNLTFRWSQDTSYLLMSVPPQSREVALRLSGGRPRGVPLPRVTVSIDGEELSSAELTNEFRDYGFPIPPEDVSAFSQRADGVQIRIQSSTWVPRTVLGGSDTRALGVMIDRAEIR